MKKTYTIPEVELERFFWEDVLTSSGIGEGDGIVDNLGDGDDTGFIPVG